MPAIFGVAVIGPILALFIRFLVGTLITRAIAVLGISIVSYNITGAILNSVKTRIDTFIYGLPAAGIEVASSLGMIEAFNVIFSAYVGALTIRQAYGTVNRLTFGTVAP